MTCPECQMSLRNPRRCGFCGWTRAKQGNGRDVPPVCAVCGAGATTSSSTGVWHCTAHDPLRVGRLAHAERGPIPVGTLKLFAELKAKAGVKPPRAEPITRLRDRQPGDDDE